MAKDQNYSRPRILYVDAYDSFANNVVGLLESVLAVDVTIVKIDDALVAENLESILLAFDAVVVGPGPGDPTHPPDVGFIPELWKLSDANILPILGICLGFQSLGHAFGASIQRLKRPRHGIVTLVANDRRDIFISCLDFKATQYHSLFVNLGGRDKSVAGLFEPNVQCPSLWPLAWTFVDEVNEPVLMAVRHVDKPFWGLQFHPESVCTEREANEVIKNWWRKACHWLYSNGRSANLESPWFSRLRGMKSLSLTKDPSLAFMALRAALTAHYSPANSGGITTLAWKEVDVGQMKIVDLCENLKAEGQELILLDGQDHQISKHSIIGFVVPEQTKKLIYSVRNCRLTCTISGHTVCLDVKSQDQVWDLLQEALDAHKPQQLAYGPPELSPFWAGWMGYISYETGLESIGVELPAASLSERGSDVNMAFVERSIVVDHKRGTVYIQSLIDDDEEWVHATSSVVESLSQTQESTVSVDGGAVNAPSENKLPPLEVQGSVASREPNIALDFDKFEIHRPLEKAYRDSVLVCQDHLAAGDSYELCLTENTEILTPTETSGWELYKRLRATNPAPFGAFLRLSGATLIGSSPERFLGWNRSGDCQLRPIKGTVRKGPGVTHEHAASILNSSKERAENLMIVDLIRHDLAGVIGASRRSVSQLMKVEEYHTVFQLVSVIEGRLPDQPELKQAQNQEEEKNCTGQEKAKEAERAKSTSTPRIPGGIDVLKACLPPGSMTGAPKKRSCELLAALEQRPREVYAGVLGYMDVGGGGDFAVVIRSAWRWDGEEVDVDEGEGEEKNVNGAVKEGKEKEKEETISINGNGKQERDIKRQRRHVWRVGAGGAVTAQSSDAAEFAEMEGKLESVLRTFSPS